MLVVAAVPRAVRVAGALVCAQGVLGVAFAVVLVVSAASGSGRVGDILGEAGYFFVLSAGVLAAGIGLVVGRTWARTPAIVVQLLLLGVAWYTAVPSGRPEFGVPVAAVCLLIGGLLMAPSTRSWAERTVPPSA
jgi:hypothetical protein